MQARYYDPVIGRFLSVDPVGFLDTQNPSFFNRYRYCSNDPVNCTDPTGQSDLFKKFFDFGASDAAATASRSMESFATSEGMNPNGATDMMNDVLAAGAIGQLEGMANGAANIVDIAGNEIMSSAMDGDTVGVAIGAATLMVPARIPGKKQAGKAAIDGLSSVDYTKMSGTGNIPTLTQRYDAAALDPGGDPIANIVRHQESATQHKRNIFQRIADALGSIN